MLELYLFSGHRLWVGHQLDHTGRTYWQSNPRRRARRKERSRATRLPLSRFAWMGHHTYVRLTSKCTGAIKSSPWPWRRCLAPSPVVSVAAALTPCVVAYKLPGWIRPGHVYRGIIPCMRDSAHVSCRALHPTWVGDPLGHGGHYCIPCHNKILMLGRSK